MEGFLFNRDGVGENDAVARLIDGEVGPIERVYG